MDESPLARREILEAMLVLRDAGITPEQYRDLDLTEHWRVGSLDGESFGRDSAFDAARARAADSGEEVVVWRSFGPHNDGAEQWIVKPDGTTWLP
ncbi:hypothetical protein AB0J83_35085 [Actinoplanes sp. NPDC049596]|uniref:hypothetical protein n=1 Tax=unclassified Actinoplanes TaxID=2626549 RepID=UPI00343382FD